MTDGDDAMQAPPVVIIGAGLAGTSCGRELAAAGVAHVLIDALPDGTCELPPLSKTLFAPELSTVPLAAPGTTAPGTTAPGSAAAGHSDANPPASHTVAYTVGTVTAVDPSARTVHLSDGAVLEYSALVIATGMRARRYPEALPGGPVHTLHSLAEAREIRAALADRGSTELEGRAGADGPDGPTGADGPAGADEPAGADIGILGSGFLALELARGAADAGHRVTVYLRGPRPLRGVSRALADSVMRLHTAAGVTFIPESAPSDYRRHEQWFVAIGADAATGFLPPELPRTDHGAMHVDASLHATASLHTTAGVYAIGDAARITSGPMAAFGRLESEPMAMAQGEWLGRRLAAASRVTSASDPAPAANTAPPPDPWTAIPWHWSFQGPVRVFTAGHSAAHSVGPPVILGDEDSAAFQVALFDGPDPDARLIGVETLGTPPLHNAAKKVLAFDRPLTRVEVADPGFDMRRRSRAG